MSGSEGGGVSTCCRARSILMLGSPDLGRGRGGSRRWRGSEAVVVAVRVEVTENERGGRTTATGQGPG